MKRILFPLFLIAFLASFSAKSQDVTISAFEYFFDSDPGFGLGISLDVSEGSEVSFTESISTAGLSSGFHSVYFRAMDANGFWGPYETRFVYVNSAAIINDVVEITSLEYFFDDDPGQGNGTPVTVTLSEMVSLSESLNTSDLSTGFHNLYIRGRLLNGSWGPYETKFLYVNSDAILNDVVEVEVLEYFFDEDPGQGNGIEVNVSQGEIVSLTDQIETGVLPSGFHNLYLRGKLLDGSWGPYETKFIYVNTDAIINDVVEITNLEYFFDTDPGQGNGTPISLASGELVSGTFGLNTSVLTNGFHNVYLRGKLLDGTWGAYEAKVVYVQQESNTATLINEIEYFIDTDPGVGLGERLAFSSAEELTARLEILTSQAIVGNHRLYVRGKEEGGGWGAYEAVDFRILEGIVSEDFETGLPEVSGSGEYSLSSGTWSGVTIMSELTNVHEGVVAVRMAKEAASLTTPEFPGVSEVSFYYALPATGTQSFRILESVDGGTFEVVTEIDAVSDSYELYELVTNHFGSSVKLKFETDLTTASTQDLLIDDFLAMSLDPLEIVNRYPANGAKSVPLTGVIAFTFSEQVIKGIGDIEIVDLSDSSVVETIPVSEVSVLGDSVYFSPTQLSYASKYAILIDESSFWNTASILYFNGVSNLSFWTFTTEPNPDQPSISADVESLNIDNADAYAGSPTVTSYHVNGSYLIGNIQLTAVNTDIENEDLSFNLSLNGETFNSAVTILSSEADNREVFVSAIVPANNGRSYTGKIIHTTVNGSPLEVPVVVTELYEPASISVTTPEDSTVYIPGDQITLVWTTNNMVQEELAISSSFEGGSFAPVASSSSTATSYSINTEGFEEGVYQIMIAAPELPVPVSDTIVVILQNPAAVNAPASFFVIQNLNGSLSFSWEDTNSAELGYRIEYSSNHTNWTSYSGDLAANVVTYTAPPLASGAAYWWRVVAIGSATTAASDIRHAGNITGAGSALKFDGTDDYVLLQDSTLFDFGTGNFTVETWFKTTNSTNSQCLFNNFNGSTAAYFVLFVQAGQIRAAVASSTYEISTPTLIENDRWYHVAMVRSGDRVTIYVNGVVQATTTGFLSRNASSTGPILLGKQGSTNASLLSGEMDEVRIWNTTRSTSQLADNFQITLSGNETGLLAYYRFDHSATETLIADFGTYNFTGSWSGSGGVATPQWVSSGALTITNPTFTVTAPNGGETYQIGETIPVTFTSTDITNSELVYLDYSADGGENWTDIKNQARSLGTTITWPTAGQNLTPGANYLVRVRNEGNTVSDASNASFTLTPTGILTIMSPNGGESWKGNTTQAITWTRENIADNHLIEIRLSTNGGETYPTIIADGTFGTYTSDTYQWTVPESVSSTARIQVVNTTLSVSDASDANFTIAEPADVTAPQFTSQPVITLDGDAFSATVTLTEYGNIYLVALEDGSSTPTAAQMKDAGSGVSTLDGQVAFSTALYTAPGQPSEVAGTGSFVLNRLYDFYFTAEDTLGNLNPGYGVPNVFRNCTPLECDSLTLVSLYNEMGGENWTIGSDWLETTDIMEWDGVTIGATNRVEGLSLPDNNLTGTLSTAILDLDALVTLDLSGNEIVNIPAMTSLENLTQFDISDNRLHFDDLQANVTIEGIVYAPQKKLDEPVYIELVKGTSYQKAVQVGGSQNVYTWKLTNDSLKNVTVTSLTGNELIIQPISYANQGKYTLTVTNALVPDLTLESEVFEVLATSDLTFTAFGIDDALLTEGFGYALKIIGKGIPFDSIPRIEVANGLFFFDNLVLGDYLIAAESDREVYLPTYFKNTYLWEEADTLRLRGDQVGDLRMAFIPEPLGPDDGDNEIAGFVESDFEDEDGGRLSARRKVAQAGCSMRKFKGSGRTGQEDEWELVAYVQTNEEGQFVFDFLPDGLYRFNIEYPGIPMDPNSFVEFEIGDGVDGSKLTLEAYITEDGIQVVKVDQLSFFKKILADVSVYPNPASDYLQVRVKTMASESMTVRLLDIQGRELAKDQVSGVEQQLMFDIRTLPNGTYLLHFMDELEPTKTIMAYKVVIRH